jgi:Cu2+-exporting ATPase
LQLVATETLGDAPPVRCLALAAALEQQSEHPIARALCQAAQGIALPVATDISNQPGAGLIGHIDGQRHALGTLRFVTETFGHTVDDPRYLSLAEQGHSLVLLANPAGPLALFAVGDNLRPGARELVSALQGLDKEVILLSGDHAPAAQHVARQLGITRVIAEARPDDKLRTIQQLRDEGAIVAMTGDGVNDAASLAGAHVSIALGSGTQLAAASADIILLAEDLRALIDTRRLALRAMTIIRQNMRWAVGYNLSVLPLAALGYIAPWMAAIGMSLSSVLVVANALRLVEAPARPAVQPESA